MGCWVAIYPLIICNYAILHSLSFDGHDPAALGLYLLVDNDRTRRVPQGTTIHSVCDELVVVVDISGRQCCWSIVDWGNGRTHTELNHVVGYKRI